MNITAYLQGRVLVCATGSRPEAFMNRLHRSRIPMKSPRREEDGSLWFWLPAKDFARLREPAFKTGTRVRIKKKQGLFVAMRPFRRRFGLGVGLVLFLGLTLYCSCFIWQIEIKGCQTVSVTQIQQDLKQLGLTVGCRRRIDVGQIENEYLMGNDKLSWMSINIRGTTAYVEVKEKGLHPKMEDLSVPTNIYAARDGVILSIRDYGGTRQVQRGEPVLAGDLLVSGDWTDKYGVRRLSHCIATVIAATRRETSVTVPLQEQLRQKTGKKRSFFTISLGNCKIPLYFSKKITYNNYDMVEEEYPLRIASFAFPLRLAVSTAEEVVLQPVTRSADEARSLAMTKLGFFEADGLSGVTVTERRVTQSLTETELTLNAVYLCEENIGIELPIKE